MSGGKNFAESHAVAVSTDISSNYFENHKVRHLSSNYNSKILQALLSSTRQIFDDHSDVAARGLRILSIGCGHGEYDMQCASGLDRKILTYTGVEPDPTASAAARDGAFGMKSNDLVETDVWTGDFDDFMKEHGSSRKYDAIYIVHAIHMMHAENTIRDAMAILEPGVGVLHIAIQTRKGMPELYESIMSEDWPFRTAEHILDILSTCKISYTVTTLDCFIDTSHDKVKQLCDFLFFRDTADIIDRVRPLIEGGIKEEHVVINIQAPLTTSA